MLKAAARLLMPMSSLGYDIPPKEWFQYARMASQRTPDIAKLEEYEYQLYFACDETQVKHLKHSLIIGSELVCPAFTQSAFNYWTPNVPFLPAVPMKAEGYKNLLPGYPPIAKIKGELHLIRPQRFIELDNYKENGVQFLRERIRLIVPYRKVYWLKDISVPPLDADITTLEGSSIVLSTERVVTIRAHMYSGIPEYWDKLISNFDYTAVQSFQAKNRRWCPEYYQLRSK